MVKIIKLELSNIEWHFLHIQIEKFIKENQGNHIAKSIFNKLIENLPNIKNIKFEFSKEYESNWIEDKDFLYNYGYFPKNISELKGNYEDIS